MSNETMAKKCERNCHEIVSTNATIKTEPCESETESNVISEVASSLPIYPMDASLIRRYYDNSLCNVNQDAVDVPPSDNCTTVDDVTNDVNEEVGIISQVKETTSVIPIDGTVLNNMPCAPTPYVIPGTATSPPVYVYQNQQSADLKLNMTVPLQITSDPRRMVNVLNNPLTERRRRNKEAQRRVRERKQTQNQEKDLHYTVLEEENARLKYELNALKNENFHLKIILKNYHNQTQKNGTN